MWLKIGAGVLLCAALLIDQTNAFVKRDISASTPPNPLETFQVNADQLRHCLDQVMARSVNDVNVKHLQPVFNVIGDQINRFSKALEDLTGSTSTKKPDPDFDF